MKMKTLICIAALALSIPVAAIPEPQGQTVDGDLTIDNMPSHVTGTYQSRQGSVIINQKVDDHSDVTILAARDVNIGQKIDQHSAATIDAGGSVSIGQKIDQHSIAIITARTGNVTINQKIDQHSCAIIKVPNGTLTIGQGVDQNSHLHYQAKFANLGSLGPGATVDQNVQAVCDPQDSGPSS